MCVHFFNIDPKGNYIWLVVGLLVLCAIIAFGANIILKKDADDTPNEKKYDNSDDIIVTTAEKNNEISISPIEKKGNQY